MATSPSAGRQRRRGWLLRALGIFATVGFLVSLFFLVASEPELKTELVAATDHSPPFQIVHPDGRISGAVVDAITLSAERAGIRVRWIHMDVRPEEVLGDSNSGVDLWPMVTTTPERKQRFHATQPIGRAEYLIAALDDGNLPLTDFQPQRVALTAGPWLQHKLSSDFPNTKSVIVKSGQQLAALCDGKADALIADAASLYQMALQLPASCAGKRLANRLLVNWYWDLAIGSTFARSAEADRIRAEFGHLARSGSLHEVFADYPIQAQYRSQDTFAETRTERDARISRMTLVGLCVCCLALLGILAESRRRTREAIRLVKLKSDFLDRMSHELRTPLNGVLGLASLLATTSLSAQQRDYLRLIRQSGEELLRLVSDSLDLSRLTAQTREKRPEAFCPRALIEDTVAVLAPLAETKRLQLVWVVAREVPRYVLGDAVAVRQLLINLVGNALKYSPSGNIRVALQCTGIDSGHPFFRFEVDDSGPGIPKADRSRIFDSFVRLERSQDQGTVGTGLGLAIARELVVLLNGRIGVGDSAYGGARFWFDFPVELATSSATENGVSRPVRVLAPTERRADTSEADPASSDETTEGGELVLNPWRPHLAHLVFVRSVDDEDIASVLLPPESVDAQHSRERRSDEPETHQRMTTEQQEEPHQNAEPSLESGATLISGLHSLARATVAASGDSRTKNGAAMLGGFDVARGNRNGITPFFPGMRLSESLEMLSQHLEMGRTSLVLSFGLREAVKQADAPAEMDLIVVECADPRMPLRQIVARLRKAHGQPFLPVVSVCSPSCADGNCDGFRLPLMRMVRRPIVTTQFENALEELRAEQAELQNSPEQFAQRMTQKVMCAESHCPVPSGRSSHVILQSLLSAVPGRATGRIAAPVDAHMPRLQKALQLAPECCPPGSEPSERSNSCGLSPPVDAPRKRALVADDNPVNQIVLVAMLRSLGVEADVVADGNEALSACEKGRYEYLILDHHMPKLDGLGATRVLRASDDWRSSVAIIASSAANYSLNEERYRDAGVDAFLPKPFTLRQLRETLERADMRSNATQSRSQVDHPHSAPAS